jgi:hypothetical protein
VSEQEEDERVHLTFEQASAMLPAADHIHTFRGTGPIMIGADWPRDDLLSAIREHGAELAGPGATGMGHGLVLIDNHGPLFIETVTP